MITTGIVAAAEADCDAVGDAIGVIMWKEMSGGFDTKKIKINK